MARNRRQSLQCKWACCPQQGQVFSSPDELSLHVVDSHVNPCSKHDLFICHWEGCKVYNRPSYSFGWLQRHVKQKHTKERPNKCLMNGCNMSFNSVDALQKHMLRHFDTHHTISPSSSPKKATAAAVAAAAAATARETPDALSSKVSVIEIQKVSSALCTSSSSVQGSEVEGMDDQVLQVKDPLQTLLYMKQQQHSMKVKIPRKTLYSSCPYTKLPVAFNGAHFHSEVMDRKTMSVIRHTANSLARQDISSLSSPSITLTAKIIGERKQDLESEQEVLVRWTPRVVPDEWMYVHHYCCSKVVNFSDLPSSQLSLLASKCYSFNKFQGRKSKRKP